MFYRLLLQASHLPETFQQNLLQKTSETNPEPWLAVDTVLIQ